MRGRKLRAPSADGEPLQAPPLAELPALLAAGRERLRLWDADVQGRRATVLRDKARSEAFEMARRHHAETGLDPVPADLPTDSVVAGGHQPELFHPGVWIKNFALGALARSTGSVGLNLIVDNDIPKGSSILAPGLLDGALVRSAVDFDVWAGEIPFEAQSIVDFARFASFGARLSARLDGLVADPLVERFWPLVLEDPGTRNVGLRFARARRLIEAEWGVRNLEAPLGRICGSEAFLWFASHLIAHLGRFGAIHNERLLRHRAANGIRSANHPVADLRTAADGWLETPFWVWRDATPRRRSLWARSRRGAVDLRIAGEDAPFAELPLAPEGEACCAVEVLRGLPDRGVRIRTRALTTTMFARLFLSDLFLHGIGGAKYDELGDEITERFFGLAPPEYGTVSLTLRVGLPSTGADDEALRRVERGIRDLEFNADRRLGPNPPGEALRLAAEKREAIAGPTGTRRERVDRWRRLRDLNRELAGFVADERGLEEARRRDLLAGLRREAVVRSREFPLVVHSASKLRRVLTDLTGVRTDDPKNRGKQD